MNSGKINVIMKERLGKMARNIAKVIYYESLIMQYEIEKEQGNFVKIEKPDDIFK